MDPKKTDNEGELTSTMDNVISVPSKDEKSDTSSDATPTSSTDANIRPAASHIALDDPISSTSSDSLDQIKVKMDKGDNASINVHRVSTDNEADLLDITNITNNEKITEDVEDLVHDLESLLGESTDSFSVTSKFTRKDVSSRPVAGPSNDTSTPKENNDVAVDDVLQELEELAGNVITHASSVSVEKDFREPTVENVAPVESTDKKIEIESEIEPSNVCDEKIGADEISSVENILLVEPSGSGNSDVVTNSGDLTEQDVSETHGASATTPTSDVEDKATEEETTSSSNSIDPQETLCIQDQDISHSEPKDILETAESTTCETSKEPSEPPNKETSEDVPSKTDDVVTSSEGDPNEKMQTEIIEEKSEVTGSEEVETLEEVDNIHTTEETSSEVITCKKSSDGEKDESGPSSENKVDNIYTSEEISSEVITCEKSTDGENDRSGPSSENKVECCKVSKETPNECIEETRDILSFQKENVSMDFTDSVEVIDSKEVDKEIVERTKEDDSDGNIEYKKKINEEVDSTHSDSSSLSKPQECLTNAKDSEEIRNVEIETTSLNMIKNNIELTETKKEFIIGKSTVIENNKINDLDACKKQQTESEAPVSLLNVESSNPKDSVPTEASKMDVEVPDVVEEVMEVTPSDEKVPSPEKTVGEISGEPNKESKESKVCNETDEHKDEISPSQSGESTTNIKVNSEIVEKIEPDVTVASLSEKTAESIEMETDEVKENNAVEEKGCAKLVNELEEASNVVESSRESQISTSVNEEVAETVPKEVSPSDEPIENTSGLEVGETKSSNEKKITKCPDISASIESENLVDAGNNKQEEIDFSETKNDNVGETHFEKNDNKEFERTDKTTTNEVEINDKLQEENIIEKNICENSGIELTEDNSKKYETEVIQKKSCSESVPSTSTSACKNISEEEMRSVEIFAAEDSNEKEAYDKEQQETSDVEMKETISSDEKVNLERDQEKLDPPDEMSEDEVPNLILEPDDDNVNKAEDVAEECEEQKIDKNKDASEVEEIIPKDDQLQENLPITTERETITVHENITESVAKEEKEAESEGSVVEIDNTKKSTVESVLVEKQIVEDEPMETSVPSEEQSEADTQAKAVEIEDNASSAASELLALSTDNKDVSEDNLPTSAVDEAEKQIETPPINIDEELNELVESSSMELTEKSPGATEPTDDLVETALTEESKHVESLKTDVETIVAQESSEQEIKTSDAGSSSLTECDGNAVKASIKQSVDSDEPLDQTFDAVKEPTKTSTELLESIPEPSVPIVEQFESIIEPSEFVVDQSAPAAEPSEPMIESSEPITEPVVETSQSIVEESAQVVEPSEPVVDSSEPVASEPVVEPSGSITESPETIAQSSQSIAEPSPVEDNEGLAESVEKSEATEAIESEEVAEIIQNVPEEIATNEETEESDKVEVSEQDETAMAVASLEEIDIENNARSLSEKEKQEMEALRQAVESITHSTEDDVQKTNDGEEHTILLTDAEPEESKSNEVLKDVEEFAIAKENVQEAESTDSVEHKNEDVETREVFDEAVPEESVSSVVTEEIVEVAKTVEDKEVELPVDDEESESSESVETNEVSPNGDVSSTQLNNCELVENNDIQEDVLPDSSQSVSDTEHVKDDQGKEHKSKSNERSKRHKKTNDSRSEEDVSDKEKPYSPKVTIKPIKVPDEEVSTTSNSENESAKGSLKMTITKQSDKMHSILKVSEVEQDLQEQQDEPLPKLKIKSKAVEHTPVKMSTRSSRQTHQTNTSNAPQRSSSPRITIKPLVKPETLSPLKIKIGLKTDDSTKKHSPKLNIKPLPKPEEEVKEVAQIPSPRKVVIKNIVKPSEDEEPAPKITIKPIPKPEMEKEATCVSPKLNIKPIRKPEDEEENDADKHSPKITIKPIVKPPEPDSHSDDIEDENKKRIVLKINKGNLPGKESRKREHPPDDDKAEKLAKITVKFSKEGGHPHIVQQAEETQQKRPHDDPSHLEKNKKQKIEAETVISTRSKQKDYIEAQSNPIEPSEDSNDTNPKTKQQISDNPGHGSSRGKRKDSGSNSPIEAKRSKLKEPKQKDNPETKKVVVEEIPELVAVDSPLAIVEDPATPNPGPNATPVSTPEVSVSTPSAEVITPIVVTPQPRKRGRPRKVPLEQRPDFESPPPQPKTVESSTTPTESGRPKRSCRGQSALDTLGLKPRKPRGSRGGRGGPKAAAGETRAIPMKPEKETKLSQAKLKLMQKAISEAGTVNVISVGAGDDKTVDIEDVLPQTQVDKKNFDCEENKAVQGEVKKGVEKIEVAIKSEIESGEDKKEFNADQTKPEGTNLKSILQQVIKSKISESKKEEVTELETKSKFVEGDEENAKTGDISEAVAVKTEVESKGDDGNIQKLEAQSAVDDNVVDSSRIKQDIVKLEGLKNPNPKTHLLNTNASTSEEVVVASSSTSPCQELTEAMLVSDPVPQDASLPKSFGVSEDSLLLAPESSSVIHSSVSSTTGPSEVVMVDEETRMSADRSSRAQTPAKQIIPMDTVEESQSSVLSTATTESGKASSSRPSKAPRLEVQEPEGSIISPDQLAEYYWNGQGPYMLQEQVAHFLGIKSFKRKYPGIKRRMLEMQERDFIRESGLVSEHMCDLGLTAVNSADILDIMYSDFQEKYEEYCKHQRDRQTKELINKQKALSLAASQEKNKADLTENARQSAAQWNANFNKARREQRRACMDLQTYTVHFPKGRTKQFSKGKPGNFPVALVPGQFTDYYKEFTPTEINNLPLNTMCYEPVDYIRPEESSDSDSDGSDSDSDSSSSSSDSDSSSSSGMDDCKLCKHSPKKVVSPTPMK